MNYEPLRGQGTQGDFVLNSQTIATDEGFSHVSKTWYDKTLSYDEGMELLESERGQREDFLIPRSEIAFDVREIDGQWKFGAEIDDRFFVPTDHALVQLVSKACNGKGTGFVRDLTNDHPKFKRDEFDARTIRGIITNGIRRVDASTKYKIRCHNDGTMRAFLSERYAEVDNRWYLEQIKNIIPAGRLSHWKGDSNTIWGNVLIPDTIREEDDSDYGGMVSIGNCEIGKRNVKSLPSVFRAICMNGCIWDQTKGYEIKVRHIGDIDLDQLKLKLRHNIEAQIPLIPQGIERVLGIRAKGSDGISMKRLVGATAETFKIDRKGASGILGAWVSQESKIAPEDRSLFDVVNSVTRAGQSLDNQSWVRYDEIGGALVNYSDSQWSRLKSRAESYDDKELDKLFTKSLSV